MYTKLYAQIVGVVLLLLGVVGLFIEGPGQYLLGILNVDLPEDVIHLVLGAVFAYLGFANTDLDLTKTIVGVVGIVLIIVGILGFLPATDKLFVLTNPYTAFDNIVHLLLGVIGAILAFLLPGTEESRSTV